MYVDERINAITFGNITRNEMIEKRAEEQRARREQAAYNPTPAAPAKADEQARPDQKQAIKGL